MTTPTFTFATAILVAASLTTSASADDINVASQEYVDVIETVDGSIWKGVVTEQTPNVSYKIETADGSVHVLRADDVVKLSKERNSRRRVSRADIVSDDGGREVDTPPSAPLPPPSSGLRLSPDIALAIPRGDLVTLAGGMLQYRSSMAVGARAGYEVMNGNVGWSFGALARMTSWQLPVEIAAAGSHWTRDAGLRSCIVLRRACRTVRGHRARC